MAYYGNVVPPPYQPQTTPFPQGFSYGVGAGVNNFVSNLIAAALYKREQERQAKEEALRRVGVLAQVGGAGALNAPSGQEAMRSAGMPAGQIPLTPEAELHATQGEALRDQLQQRRQFRVLHPEFAGYPDSVLDDLIKLKAQQDMWERFPNLMNQFLGGREEPEYMGVPGSTSPSVPQGPTSGAPGGGAAPAGRVTQRMGVGPTGPTASVEIAPPPESKLEQEATATAVADARRQILSEAQAGKQIYGPDGKPTTIVGLANAYQVSVTDLVNALATDAARMQGHKIPAEAPSMEKIRAEHQRRTTETQRTEEFKISQQRLDLEAKRLNQLIAQGNRAERTHNDELSRQYRVEAQKAATTVIETARFLYDQNEKDIRTSLQPTPEQLEKRRVLSQRIADAVTTLQSLTPASEAPGKPTPEQSPVGVGRSGYPSKWFNPKAPQAAPAPTQAPPVSEGEDENY